MSGLLAAAETAWRTLGVVLIHGTVLAALAWLLSITLLRRARPATLAALWAIVLAKFALPIGPALPFSLSDALTRLFASGPAGGALPVATGPVVAAPVASAPGVLAWLAAIGLTLWIAGVALVAVRAVGAARRARRGAEALPVAPAEVV
ncbi:MAG: hypothetical protein K8W52_16320, partial [Deltaproteobacteria bacterium]|nr:hypothetical protein [Deltaproteobacteria bacterium]